MSGASRVVSYFDDIDGHKGVKIGFVFLGLFGHRVTKPQLFMQMANFWGWRKSQF
jgi:hypothetical protein